MAMFSTVVFIAYVAIGIVKSDTWVLPCVDKISTDGFFVSWVAGMLVIFSILVWPVCSLVFLLISSKRGVRISRMKIAKYSYVPFARPMEKLTYRAFFYSRYAVMRTEKWCPETRKSETGSFVRMTRNDANVILGAGECLHFTQTRDGFPNIYKKKENGKTIKYEDNWSDQVFSMEGDERAYCSHCNSDYDGQWGYCPFCGH